MEQAEPFPIDCKTDSEEKASSRKRARVASYCTCGQGDGDMIGCDGTGCPGNGWFHPECVGIKRSSTPRGTWYCPDCTLNRKYKRGNTSRTNRRAVIVVTSDRYIIDNDPRGKSEVLPLKVAAAERQSREEMENLMTSARIISFDEHGRAVNCCNKTKKASGPFPNGLCRLTLATNHFKAIRKLHRVITNRLGFGQKAKELLTPWAGVAESDNRRRGYAFLPASYGKFGKEALVKAGVRFHAAEKRGHLAKKDESANWKACIRLKDAEVTSAHVEALQAVISAVRAAIPKKYRACISLDNLQALQPNLHNGCDHLPPHIDSPLHDGFGVVIVTICMHHSAQIMMLPSPDSLSKNPNNSIPLSSSTSSTPFRHTRRGGYSVMATSTAANRTSDRGAHSLSSTGSPSPFIFEANEGDMYVLCAEARNSFDHGVLCALEKRSARGGRDKLGDEITIAAGHGASSAGNRSAVKRKGGDRDKGRESLNLRFAIHGNRPGRPYYVGEEMPLFA